MGDFSEGSDIGKSDVGSGTEKTVDSGKGDGVNEFNEKKSETKQENFNYQEGANKKDLSEDKKELSSKENSDKVSNEFEEATKEQQDSTTEQTKDLKNGETTEQTKESQNGETTEQTKELNNKEPIKELSSKENAAFISDNFESSLEDDTKESSVVKDNTDNKPDKPDDKPEDKPDKPDDKPDDKPEDIEGEDKTNTVDSNAEKDSNSFSGAEKPADFQAKDVNETNNQESGSEAREISEDLKESLQKFEQDDWETMTPEQQKEAIVELGDSVANELGIKNKPDVIFYDVDDSTDFGGYSPSENAIYINEYNMGDAYETADTIVHESRHCWQHERAENPVTPEDFEYKENFDNYISPDFDYDEYRNQPVEVDAREYASSVLDNIGTNTEVSTIEESAQAKEGEADSYTELNEEKGAVFDKPDINAEEADLPDDVEEGQKPDTDDDTAEEADLPDDIEGKRLEHLDNLRDGLIKDRTNYLVKDYADSEDIDLYNMSDEEKVEIANKTEEYKQEILRNPDKMIDINDKADALLKQSDERMKEAYLSGFSADGYYDIVNTPKNERTEEAYKEALEGSSIEQEFYEDFFKEGSNIAVCYMAADKYDEYVEDKGVIGFNDGLFVIPEHVANEIEDKLEHSNHCTLENPNDEFKRELESELALPQGKFSSGIVRVEIPIDRDTLHIPYGTEGGANYQWVPGGKTLGGIREGIAAQVTRDNNPDLYKDITSTVKRGK